ncbi:MAG: tRNA (N(6)-L-threonylcarbamoyladenosine(37)-C(2))-methylthiotransferase MtaB, partial [Candidatus Rokuibacteriota bacterium]
LHVFPYSARKGTEAACLAGAVDARTIAHRARVLRELARRKSLDFRRRLVGSVEEVLVLATRERGTGRLTGLTGHNVEVRFESADALTGRLTRVRVTSAERDRTLGELVAT